MAFVTLEGSVCQHPHLTDEELRDGDRVKLA